jgi:ferric-dicitrate binding protein FerR (iron transport regulator)
MMRSGTFVSGYPNNLRLRWLSLGRAILLACMYTTGLAVVLSGGAAAQQKNIGNATRIVHVVTGAISSTETPAVLRAGIDVFSNEIVKTAEESAALLVFQDKTELSIGADSEIVLDKFVFDPDPNKSAVAVSILSGVARFSTGVLPKSAYTIRTPSATMSVRGTTLVITVQQGQPGGQPGKTRRQGFSCDDPLARKTQVDVTAGTVAVTAQGETVQVDTGHSSTVQCGSPPSAPFSSPPQSQAVAQMETLLQQATLQTSPATGFGFQNLGGVTNPGGTTSGSVGSVTNNCITCSTIGPGP